MRKAYDRLDRGWLFKCIEALGFPLEVGRWVRLMLHNTQAGVLYHGFLSPWVDVLSGVAQGSPLSPALYLIAAQPLAAKLRLLQNQGLIDNICLPGGTRAPSCHQHADDTSVHTATAQGAKNALDLAVVPFSVATNAKLNVGSQRPREWGGGVRVIPLGSLLTRAFCANGSIGSRGSLVGYMCTVPYVVAGPCVRGLSRPV